MVSPPKADAEADFDPVAFAGDKVVDGLFSSREDGFVVAAL